MITGEMYDNHDLYWSAKQKSIGVQPSAAFIDRPLEAIHGFLEQSWEWKILNKNAITQKHKIRLRKSSDVSQSHRTAGIVVVDTKSCLIRSSTLYGESRTMDVRWVSMQMHLSLIMPNPDHATVATCPSFRWLLCGRVWGRGNF